MNQASNNRSSLLIWISFLLLGMVWGSSFILIKKGLEAFSPVQVASIRISIAFFCFMPFMFTKLRGITKKQWINVGIVGLCGSGLPAFLYAIAQTKVSSSAAGILNSLTAIFALVLGVLFYQVILKKNQVIGVLVGFIGAVIIALISGENNEISEGLYSVFIVVATIMYAISVNTVKRNFQSWHPLKINAGVFVIIGLPTVIYLIGFSDFFEVLSSHPSGMNSFGYLSILAIGSTVLANVLFYYLVQWTDAIFASTISYFIPFIALGWGYLAGEQITWIHFAGMILVLLGVYLVKRKN